MMLIYSKEVPGGPGREASERNYTGHLALMEEAARKGIFGGAEPLAPTSSATTVRVENGKALITEQLAGYYILDCQNLDEAIEWAARIPTMCKGGEGCVEIRPLPGIPRSPELESATGSARSRNG
jgi:hypothetical protein